MISRKRLSALLALACLIGGIASTYGQDPVVACLKYIPGEANILVVLRVEQLLLSPRGTKEGWAKQNEEAFLGGTVPLPPWVDVGVRAALFRPEEGKLDWSLGLVTADDFNLDQVAEYERAKPELFAGHRVIRTSRGSYVTQVNNQLLAVFSPAYRQEMARWMRRYLRPAAAMELSPYLKNAATSGEPQVLLAVDTEYLFEPDRLDAWLKAAPSLAQHQKDVAGLSRLFRGLRGAQFRATVEDTTTASVRLDFGDDIGPRGELVKGVFLDFLDDSSAVLEDFQQARVSVEGHGVTLQTTLSDSGLKRILSLIVTPTPGGTRPARTAAGKTPAVPPKPGSDASTSAPSTRTTTGPEVEISRRYYRAVNQLVDDLSLRSQRARYSEKTSVWHDNYAKKIEQMSINGVHPDLVSYGATVASRLHGLGASLRGVPLQLNNIQGTLTYNMQVTPGYAGGGWWGGGGYSMPTMQVTSNLQQVRERQAEEVAKGNDQRQQIWSAMESDRQAIRQKMYDIFHVDFEPPAKK